jgi:purine-binding chemotaxis protein CheW
MVLAIFHLGDEVLAVEASAVQEITLMARLSRPSGVPALIAGFLNLAQRPIPILRLDRLLRVPESKLGLYTQILVLREAAGAPVGWIVDRVAQIIPVRLEDVLPVPENHCFRDCATGVITRNDTSISILAPERVLLEQERRCIEDFQAREQERLRELEISEP